MPPELKTPPRQRLIATGTTGVFRRGDRFVAVTYRHGRRIKTTHDTKRDACAARARRLCGAPVPSRESFEDYAERWLVEYRGRTSRGLAPSTREAYAWTMRTWVIPYFRGMRLADVRRSDVKRFIDHLNSAKPLQCQQGANRLTGSTIRKIVTPLKAMLAEAYELDLLATDAGRVHVIGGRAPTTPPKTLSREQIDALMEQLDPRDRLLMLLLRWTGLRISEALGLRWDDLRQTNHGYVLLIERQWQDGQLVERTKTAAGVRAVAVVPSLDRALVEARTRTRFDAPEDPIFSTRLGTHQDSHNLRRRLRPAARAAGVPWVTPHVLRHSLATELLDYGHDISTVAKILGHGSEAFTRRIYVHARARRRASTTSTPDPREKGYAFAWPPQPGRHEIRRGERLEKKASPRADSSWSPGVRITYYGHLSMTFPGRG
jgi:integrase